MTGYVSLGHGSFSASAPIRLRSPPLCSTCRRRGPGARPGCAGAGRLGVGLALLTSRIRIAYFAVVMLGLNEITKTIVANVKSVGSSYGLTLPSVNSRSGLLVLLGVAVAVTAFAYGVQRSRWGYGLRAILADEVAAETTGIHRRPQARDVRGERRVHRRDRRDGVVELELRRSLHGVRPDDFVRHAGHGDVRRVRNGGGSGSRRRGDEHRQGGAFDQRAALPAHHLRRAGDRADPVVPWRHRPGVRGNRSKLRSWAWPRASGAAP